MWYAIHVRMVVVMRIDLPTGPRAHNNMYMPCLTTNTGTPYDMQRAAESDDDVPMMPNRLDALASRGSSRSALSSRYSRPGSAVINLRGSRPNSAAIAQEIEGFEDDFMVRASMGGSDVGGCTAGAQNLRGAPVRTLSRSVELLRADMALWTLSQSGAHGNPCEPCRQTITRRELSTET
jgi:hypothetical protein